MGAVPFNVPPGNRKIAGDFHRPYENSETGSFYHSTGDTPSVTPDGRDSSLREGAGVGCVPFNVPLGKRNVAGDFHRPYENSETGSFYHSSGDTPSVSFADSSLREGAGVGCVPFNVPLGKRKIAGDFHRPYETQNILPVSAGETIPGGAGHLRMGTSEKRN